MSEHPVCDEKILPSILIVDDTPANIGVIAENLEAHGYRVLVAQDGEEGLQRADFARPDLILLDVMMPGLDGFEVCRRLKKQSSTRDIPVIFMTARGETEDKLAGFGAGAVDYVTKPLHVDEVIARVDVQIKLREMQTRMELQNAQLQRYREQLEQRVAERTEALNVTNRHLRTEIQERKDAQEALALREREFRTLAENAPDNICRYDAQCRVIYMNPMFEATLGGFASVLMGKTPVEAVPDTPGAVAYQTLIEKVIATGMSCETTIDMPDTGNGIRHHHIRFTAERNGMEEIVGVLAIGRDITEHKRAEAALLAREREFHSLAETIPDNIIRYDIEGRKTYVNSTAARTLGGEAKSMVGLKTAASAFGILNEVSQYEQCLRRVLDSGEESQLETTVMHPALGVRVHNIRFVAERNETGAITGVLAIGRDVTEQKTVESALVEREQRYREIFDNATDGLYLLEVTEEGRFRTLDVNPKFVKSTGMSREAFIGKYVEELFEPAVAQVLLRKCQQCLAEGGIVDEEVALDLSGGRRYYQSTQVPVYDGERIQHIVGISRDITRIKRTGEALEHSRAELRGLMARSEQMREEERKYIAREVHDELGQILTGLQLNVSVLTHKAIIEASGLQPLLQETKMLTDKALSVARNVASALRPAALDMGIVDALEWLARRFGTNTGIACRINISDTELQLDEAQSIALFRIVQESLTNAARYAKAERVDISLGVDADDYVLKVSDNGAGFDASVKKSGSYGLVGIQERVLLLDGIVDIDSSIGEGTKIVVRIPISRDLREL